MITYFSSNRITETLLPAIKSVITEPRLFFEEMQATTSYRDSLILMSLIMLVPSLIISLPTGIFALLVIPFFLGLMLVCTWLWAWYLSWAVRVFSKSQLSTAAAFQICAYSAVPQLLSWVPGVNIFTSLWNLYLTWQGLVSHAKVGSGKALLILVIPMILFVMSLVVLFGLLFSLMSDMGLSPDRMPDMEIF
jgi:hypothetical protein